MSKNLKNIIREEIKDFDWIKNQEGMDPLLYELKNTNQNYKIWFGSIDTDTQNHIADHLKSLGLNVRFNTKIKHNINSIGFDSLYFNYINPRNEHGPDSYHYFVPQWSIDYMGCTNTEGDTGMQKCDENGASYGKGLESNRNYFDDKDWDGNKNIMELSSSLVESKTINESDDMDWIKDVDTPQVGDTYKYLVQKELEIMTAEFVITNIIPTPWTQSKYVIKYTIQGNTAEYEYEIYLDDFLTAVEEGRFVKIKEINESDDMEWIKDIPAGIEIGACFKYSSGSYKLGVIEKITIISDDNDYYPKEISSIEELTTADYENTWVYLKNQETGYQCHRRVNGMVNNLEDGVLIPC